MDNDISEWTAPNVYLNWDSCRVDGYWFTYYTDCREVCDYGSN